MFWTFHNAFEEMNTLRRELDQFVQRTQQTFASGSSSAPAINMYQDSNQITVVAELPGVQREDLDMTYHDGTLKLIGKRGSVNRTEEQIESLRQERPVGHFEKVIKVPFDVNIEQIDAKLQDGVLQVILPKAESARPKQILIG